MPTRVANSATAARFELPALDLNFGSITDGTTIPPPPASPVQKVPTPPRTPPPAEKEKPAQNGGEKVKEAESPKKTAPQANGNIAGTKRRADEEPVSPSASTRPGSLRRLLSRTMLNHSYTEGNLTSSGSGSVAGGRPGSRSGASFMDDRKSKRSSGWFRRLKTNDTASRRSSILTFEEKPMTAKSTGPPPPMIPELTEFDKDEGGLGDDLFKNIK